MDEELNQNGEWCMKKEKQQAKEEEEINRGKVKILIIMLGVEEFVLGARKKKPFIRLSNHVIFFIL